jgi:MFS family permease
MTRTRHKLYAATFLADGAMAAMVFGVSRMLAESGASLLTLGLVGAGVSVGWVLVAWPAGRLSDHRGRVWVIRAGVLVLLISALGCLRAEQRLPLMLLYSCTGVGGGIFYGGLIPWLGEGESGIGGGRRRALRTLLLFCISWNLGMVSGQFFGGLLFAVSDRLPLLLSAGMSTLNLALTATLRDIPSAPQVTQTTTVAADAEQVFSAAFARMSWVANMSGTYCVATVFHLFPHLAVGLDIPPGNHGSVLAAMRLTTVLTYVLMFFVSGWHHRFRYIVLVRLIGFSGVLLLCTATSAVGLVLGLCMLGCMLGFNYFSSLYYNTTAADDDQRGGQCGIAEMTLALGMAVGTVVGGLAGHHVGARGPYLAAAVVVALFFLAEIAIYCCHVAPVCRAAANAVSD